MGSSMELTGKSVGAKGVGLELEPTVQGSRGDTQLICISATAPVLALPLSCCV
jgi:hypothetical protein